MSEAPWLTVARASEPLIVSLPHTGTDLGGLEPRLVSSWLAQKDTDWRIDELYDFAADLGATVIRTALSRTIVDVNRDPSGASLYPGQATTELCPMTTFDGEPLYLDGAAPDDAEIGARRAAFFDPYHAALREEIARLHADHSVVALYDCHSIRSVIPRLFDGELPCFNLGTNGGASADADLTQEIAEILRVSGETYAVNGRFKGGWITRNYGHPISGVHALQMELACRAYLREPIGPVSEADWPPLYDAAYAEGTRRTLRRILEAILASARRSGDAL